MRWAAPALLIWALAFPALVFPGLAAEPLFALYAGGHYAEAMRAGEVSRTAVGYAIAARAALADAMLQPNPCLPCLERAEAFARRAVAADPGHSDGQVWLAVALGHEARVIGPLASRLRGAPAEAKDAMDAAVRADPANPYALAALGGWNIEIVRVGGSFLARRIFGAGEAAGLALFDRAVAAAPGNVAVRYQVALSLSGYDRARFERRIRAELEAARTSAPATAYERFMQGRATDLLALLKAGDEDVFAERVRKYQGYP